MRQFVLGVVVAGVAWWGYDRWYASPAHASNPGGVQVGVPAAGNPQLGNPQMGNPQRGSGTVGSDLDGMLGSVSQTAPAAADEAGEVANEARGGVRDGKLSVNVDELLARVAARDPAAISMAWILVASDRIANDRSRVVAALAPRSDDFESHLAALGNHNAFLHSVEGRAAAAKVRDLVASFPDNVAVKAGSQLLALMVRGRIDRDDRDVRKAVDLAYRQHLVRAERWICDPTNVAGARSYTVMNGDFLGAVARKFRRQGINIDDGAIAKLNRISNPNVLRVGQKLKIPVAPIHAMLEKRSYALMVYVGDELLRLYWVGHGVNDRTPVTTFTVIDKQEKPDWTAPNGYVYPYSHPKNILGEYFIKFAHDNYSGFGAHGTPEPETICTQSSAGCLRMFDQDIAELFSLLPRGSEVEIQVNESVPSQS